MGAAVERLETNQGQHPLILLISACFWVILWLLSCVKTLAAFATITLPRTIYFILSYSMTLTLNFWSFAMLFVISAIALNYWTRARYLNDYASLKEPPLIKPGVNELHPDINSPEAPHNFHNYLDDFLQAVRVFGFLEKPVFHELARHLQTRRLVAGDSISLDQDKNFYCVVDGTVQVFAHRGNPPENQTVSWDDEDLNGYQLLNEVGSGGTLSSLFTILSLFTEDVKISWQDVAWSGSPHPAAETLSRSRSHRMNSDVSNLDLDHPKQPLRRRRSVSSTTSTVHVDALKSPRPDVHSPDTAPEELDGTKPTLTSLSRKGAVRLPPRIHHGVVARAKEDSTLAFIPAEAFSRLTKKFPKATAHIVQVILTRFSRVTFNAAHRYLGLTKEVLRTEKAINEIACHPLPASFYEGGGLQYLRQRFDTAGTPVQGDHNYRGSSHSRIPSSLSSFHVPSVMDSPVLGRSSLKMMTTRQLVQAGDLHSSTGHPSDSFHPLSRSFSIISTSGLLRPGLEPEKPEDFDLREEVMSCIAKSIGLLQPPLSGTDSDEASPALLASDGTRTLFTSPYSSLSLLEMPDDNSSVNGGLPAVNTAHMSGLDNDVEILYFAAGSTLVKAGERNAGLFFVIDGFLDILLPVGEHSHHNAGGSKSSSSKSKNGGETQKLLFTVKPGGIAGYLASLCSIASYVDIKAKTDTYVGFLPSHALQRLLEKRPIVLLTLAKRLISLLSPLVLQIDASLDWMQVNAGQVLWRKDEVSDSFYIVINGRLRAINENEAGSVIIVAEYGQGDTVGELDVITSSPRRNTVHAIRDTEVIRMPQTLFNAISARNPQTTTLLLRMIASRVRDEVDTAGSQSRNAISELGRNNTNLKTVAVLPVTRNVPVDTFARKLHQALESSGASTSYLDHASVSSHLGRYAFTRMGKLKAAEWLADQEQRYRAVLYVVDSPVTSPWTQTCIRQADFVMVVGVGEDPSIGEYERLLLSMKTTARKELILLHPDRSVVPGSTRDWLKLRPWVHQHFHVELSGLVLPTPKPAPLPPNPGVGALENLKHIRDKVQSEIRKYRGIVAVRSQRPPHTNDFARLARRICGQSIGVVLGGGGARGISHLGLLRAFEEFGIPIDHIGGTSIGAFIGGLYAREGDLISSRGRAKHFSGRMASFWRFLYDSTYPIVAYTTGHGFNRAIYKAFYDLHIEDMWLPYFCNSTNIRSSRMEIHESGYAWRFIRASMSLVGLLPPLSDNGNMLVDGGYIDNLPVGAMFATGASAIFASDVGGIDDNSPRHFGDHISGWWLLANRWNPFSSARSVPDIAEIQSRLAYVSSVKTLEDAKTTRGCVYIRMPVEEYGTLEFGKFEEIVEKGYQAATRILRKLGQEGRLPAGSIDGKGSTKTSRKKGRSVRRNSI